jgi:hypothetical protein
VPLRVKLLRPRGAPSVKTAARGPRCPNSRTADGVVLRLGQASTQEIARLFQVEPELARSMNRGSPSQRSSDRSRGARRGVPRRGSGTAYSLSAFQTSSSAQYVAARRTPGAIRPGSAARPALYPGIPAPVPEARQADQGRHRHSLRCDGCCCQGRRYSSDSATRGGQPRGVGKNCEGRPRKARGQARSLIGAPRAGGGTALE